MAQEDVIARRYGRGLAEQAAEANEIPKVRDDIRLLAGLLDPRSGETYVPEFADFLTSPSVDTKEKLAAAASIAEKVGLGKTVSDFLAVLIRHGRVGLMPRIAPAFAQFGGEMTGEHAAVVHTARPLSEDQAARLTQVLANVFGGVVHLHQRVEPGLLAGAKITVGDKTFDGTVLGKLNRLKDRLLTKGVDELFAAADTDPSDDSQKSA